MVNRKEFKLKFTEQESIATGFVRPKTTALFFDKLWIPQWLPKIQSKVPTVLEFIPSQLIFTNLDKNLHLTMSNIYWRGLINNLSWNSTVNELVELFISSDKFPDEFPDEFVTSSFRNAALLKIIGLCRRTQNIEITPIFLERTVFEDSLEELIGFRNYKKLTDKVINALDVCIKGIPSIVEKELQWEQVLAIRQDKKSFDSIKRLKRWLNAEFVGKSESEIIEGIENRIDDYQFSIKKHGVIATVGSLSTLLTSSASVISALMDSPLEIVSTSFVVSAAILTYTVGLIAEYFEEKREPIAFLYDIERIIDRAKVTDT